MVTLCGLQLTPALLFAGLLNVITGLRFRIPMTIQPMKAIAAVAIAERLSEADIVAGGIITRAVILVLGLFRSVNKLAALIPLSIVRGLQLAAGHEVGFGRLLDGRREWLGLWLRQCHNGRALPGRGLASWKVQPVSCGTCDLSRLDLCRWLRRGCTKVCQRRLGCCGISPSFGTAGLG